MRILVVGGNGMLGHQLLLTLQNCHDVRVTLRNKLSAYEAIHLFNALNSFSGIDVTCMDTLKKVFLDFQPQVVINAVGIVKQLKLATEVIPSLEINALFPHRLALMCKEFNARLIHISTDCVFSGRKGQYSENDFSDAEDLYGKTKYLGEVHDSHCLTLRSSIIGLELGGKTGLIEWFLAQKGKIKGFRKAFYSGLTTIEMSRVIELILSNHPSLSGVWHVSSNSAINKYELLTTFSELLDRDDIEIIPEDNFVCDRSLLSDRFKARVKYNPPTWEMLLKELALQVKQRETELCY